MKKQTMITLAFALTLTMPTLPSFAQKAMSKKEIAEREKAFKNLQHPWKGKKVAYFGDANHARLRSKGNDQERNC